MTIEKTNEQYRVTDTYEYNNKTYDLNGSIDKSTSYTSINLNVNEFGNFTYNVYDTQVSVNFTLEKDKLGATEEFMRTMLSKVNEIMELSND